MSVEFIQPSVVHDLAKRVNEARKRALEQVGEPVEEDAAYWIRVFEANAAAVLDVLPLVGLPTDFVVRYCFYGRKQGDLLVRPFVARATTDVTAIRRLVDWHPPPDSVAPSLASRPTKDVDLFYSHFQFERSPAGYFEYWIAIQEMWASARWIHSHVVADASHLAEISGRDGWQILQEVERCEPAIVLEDEKDVQLAVLIYCPLERASVSLHLLRIGTDQAVEFLDAIPVAHGRSGYRLR